MNQNGTYNGLDGGVNNGLYNGMDGGVLNGTMSGDKLLKVFTPLLDVFPNAAAAYSLRKLRTNYRGPAIRVRRSSDNAEQDIGFNAYNLDTVALLSFVGASSGFVTVWYDQSPNQRNATQSTTTSQPRIVNAGVIDTLNGKPTIAWSANTMRLSSYKFAAPSTNWNIVTVLSVNNVSGNNNNIWGTDGNGYQANGIYLQTGFMTVNRTGASTGIGAGTIINNTQCLQSYQYFSTDEAQAYFNNSISDKTSMLMSGNTYTNGDQSVYWIGAYRGGGNFVTGFSLLGNIQEHIVYQSDQTTNMSGIKRNINNYYKIY